MAEEYQLRSKPPVPNYFKFDQIQKDEYLSQLGNYTQEQRSLFQKICESWEPELAFERFLKKEKDGFSFLENHTRTLLNRLSNSRAGLMQMRIESGELVPHHIILCEPDSIRYFYYRLENEYLRILLQDDEKSLINPNYLLETAITLPEEYVEDLNHSEISNEFLNQQRDHVRILRVAMEGAEPFFCTPYTIEHVIRISRVNIRGFLSNSQMLTLVAKLMGSMNSEVQRNLGTTDMVFWNKLCSHLLEHKEELLMKRKNFPLEVYQFVSLIYAYTRNALAETERIRQENQDKKDEMIRVCKAIYDRNDPFLDQQELNGSLEPGLKRWEDFKELFFDKCVRIKNRTGLPLVVNIGTGYIHRDRLFPYFKTEIQLATEELQEYYRLEMEQLLGSRNRSEMSCFSTQTVFLQHIQDMLEKNKPVLSALLRKPKLVSEGIILYSKKQLKTQTAEQLRQVLDQYYEENSTTRFKRFDHLFHLYLLEIYQKAYTKMSLWRRLVMRLFGKHESYINSFSGRNPLRERRKGGPRKNEGTYQAGAVDLHGDVRKTGLTVTHRDRMPPGVNSYEAPVSRRRKGKGKEGPRNYSNRQINRAWKEFEDAMQKKQD